jgi:hypothetical protein
MGAAMDSRSPLDRLLDLIVFAPAGLVLAARDRVPELAEHGRRRLAARADLARMVGRLAVEQGGRQVREAVERRARGPRAPEGTGAPAAGPEWAGGSGGGGAPVTEPEREREREREREGRPITVVTIPPGQPWPEPGEDGPGPADPLPSTADLPIPGYDSLSASQVVQRLAGLTLAELEAVRAYEQAGRARKTVLLRVAQLRAAS